MSGIGTADERVMNDPSCYLNNTDLKPAVAKRKPENFQLSTGFEPMTSAIPVQCSTN